MALKQRIDTDLKTALLGGDRFVGEVLRGLKAAILNEEVAKGLREQGLSDLSIEQVVAREVKKRVESADLYDQGDRHDLAENEKREADILKRYLPEQISEEELHKIVTETIIELNADSPAAMGQVIGAVKRRVGNTADGALVARIVKESLSS